MTTSKRPVRILVADDNDPMRRGLCSLLRSRAGWTVCGEATNGRDAVEKALQLQPDVIVLDVSMPGLNGWDAAKCILERRPDSEILLVTEHDAKTLAAALSSLPGVRGYVRKSYLSRDLIPAIEAASNHRPVTVASSEAALARSAVPGS